VTDFSEKSDMLRLAWERAQDYLVRFDNKPGDSMERSQAMNEVVNEYVLIPALDGWTSMITNQFHEMVEKELNAYAEQNNGELPPWMGDVMGTVFRSLALHAFVLGAYYGPPTSEGKPSGTPPVMAIDLANAELSMTDEKNPALAFCQALGMSVMDSTFEKQIDAIDRIHDTCVEKGRVASEYLEGIAKALGAEMPNNSVEHTAFTWGMVAGIKMGKLVS
jgi:hypothetical protein